MFEETKNVHHLHCLHGVIQISYIHIYIYTLYFNDSIIIIPVSILMLVFNCST